MQQGVYDFLVRSKWDAEAPADVSRQALLGTARGVEVLSTDPRPGYPLVAEIGHRGVHGYLGEAVVPALQLAGKGSALASCLHAGSVDEVFGGLGRHGVAPATAASVR